MNQFENKIALITGAASGIGKALAMRCAKEKMRIVIADINEPPLRETEKELADLGVDVLAVITDVSKKEAIKNLATKTLSGFGVPHLLINNAGIGGTAEPIWKMSEETLQSVLNINLISMQRMLNTFVPAMLDDNVERYIVNVSAASGLLSSPLFANYQISKHGVVVLSECLYHDLKLINSNINVSVLCPGWVKTDILKNALQSNDQIIEETLKQNIPEDGLRWLLQFMRNVRRGISTEEVARITFDAIQKKQFYIHTHPEFIDKIQQRMLAILNSKHPCTLMD